METIINTLSILNNEELASLKLLMDMCDGYEPYYTKIADPSIIMFTASVNNKLVGFFSLLLTNEDDTAEVTALIHPDYRRMGLFSTLRSTASQWLANSSDYSHFSMIGSVPHSLASSGFPYSKTPAFAEYMLKLTCNSYKLSSSSYDASPYANSGMLPCGIDVSQCEFGFSQDETAYFMYADEAASEPCALLNLSAETTFSNIYGVWVDENLRGNGIGTLLMQAFLEDYFEDSSALPLVLNVRDTNTAAFKLYKKCGFTEVSHISYYTL